MTFKSAFCFFGLFCIGATADVFAKNSTIREDVVRKNGGSGLAWACEIEKILQSLENEP